MTPETAIDIVDRLLTPAAQLIILAGAICSLIGAVGILRFPDFYSRMHAASVTDTLASLFVFVGLAVLAGWSIASLKLALIFLFMLMTGPTASHAVANAAFRSGLAPLSGRWRSELPQQD